MKRSSFSVANYSRLSLAYLAGQRVLNTSSRFLPLPHCLPQCQRHSMAFFYTYSPWTVIEMPLYPDEFKTFSVPVQVSSSYKHANRKTRARDFKGFVYPGKLVYSKLGCEFKVHSLLLTNSPCGHSYYTLRTSSGASKVY